MRSPSPTPTKSAHDPTGARPAADALPNAPLLDPDTASRVVALLREWARRRRERDAAGGGS